VKANKSKKPVEAEIPVGTKVKREIIAWFWVGLVFLLINGTIGQARVIPSGSMENTLLIGDHVLMNRIGYDAGIPFTGVHVSLWKTPKRQQLIIFSSVVPGDPSDIVKRIIGLPGDTVDIRDGAVWINGKRLDENYTTGPTELAPPGSAPQGRPDMKFPFTVPADSFFVMGDNRGNSYDSRFVGPVPRQNIIGAPVMIYASIDAPGEAWENGGIAARLSAYASALFHPSKVRWRRLFKTF
jgi:signal peptidase I